MNKLHLPDFVNFDDIDLVSWQ